MPEPIFLLDALIDEAGMSRDGLAARVNRRGAQLGLTLLYDHASVRRWIRDRTVPRGRVPELICEVLGERIGRTLTLADIGMGPVAGHSPEEASLPQTMEHAAAMWRSDLKQVAALRSAGPLRRFAVRLRLHPCSSGRIRQTTWMWHVLVAPPWTLPSFGISALSGSGMSVCTGKWAVSRCARG